MPLILCSSISLMAQHTISGQVFDELSKVPLKNVTIALKNSSTAVITDNNGFFKLQTKENKIELMASVLGYESKTIELNLPQSTPVKIMLTAKFTDIEAVNIATGYQEISKERATGSYSHADNKLLNQQVGTNVLDRLSNMISGVTIDKGTSGTPQLMIRGISTINGPKSPLIVVDNFPYEGDISNINPNMVESITVLKDASAASIWVSGILSMHEAMERGNAKRPLIVVPNDSILKQWVETIFETIPNAKVNVLGNLGKDYDLSKFDNKDGEITIVTYEGFNNIGFSENITQELASKFSYISESELKSVNSISERDHQIELQKEMEIEGKMKRGKIYDWEDFGFDHLTYDEVHNANHIVGKVRIEDRGFASDFRSQNQQTSKLGINTWMSAQYIQDKNNGRNITLLSATPFTNKPLEYYSILSLIANKRLEESGYFNVNTFFETFMEADNDMEIDAKGDVKFKANVRRFKNNSLFQQLLSEFIDIKGEEDNPELKRPNKINKEYKIEQNDLTKEQYDLLNESFSETQKGAILTHILNARLIAISPYLSIYYDGEVSSVQEFVENSPKLKQTMELIRQNKKDIPDLGQIIYSELAVAEFPKMKEYLVNEVGYKPEEIGIITGATSKPNRLKIQDEFNSGKIKVIIGSEAIQEGMNLQENTTDVYLLSLPYNFTALRQVEGRAWRQGNKNENVRINFMLTNDSIDVFMLQKLQSKQARYLEAMKKGADVLDISDISTQELKTAIITNPETRANIEIELMKKRIENEKDRFNADRAFVLRKYEDFIKVQENVTKAEHNYNRILGYSKEEKDGEYWKNQLSSYQKTIDLTKLEVQKTIQNLAEKGVNVTEIENQSKVTEEKIAELDKKLEELPEIKDKLIQQYQREKEEQIEVNKNKDYLHERADENRMLYNFMLENKPTNNMDIKKSLDIMLQKEEINLDIEHSISRKR